GFDPKAEMDLNKHKDKSRARIGASGSSHTTSTHQGLEESSLPYK
ncbi:hypothetical protein Tco_0497324, partial [Tanacetum coccineum]